MSEHPEVDEYEAVLGRFGEVVDFDISALDHLGVPVTSCSLAVDGRFAHHANGYGLTAGAARIGGLGELAEGVLSGLGVRRLRQQSQRASRRELLRREGADRVVDPRLLCLPAGSAYTDETVLEWVPLQRVAPGAPLGEPGEQVWVPVDFVASEPGEAGGGTPLVPSITNGLGAGLDPTRPLTHSILEILQRHTNGLRFRALDVRSPVIDPDTLPPSVAALVDRFRAAGVQPVLKHAATELGVCSSYVMGLDDDPAAGIRVTSCGEAAHPSAEVSLTKSLLEYASSRARKAFFFGGGSGPRTVAPPGYWELLPDGAGHGEPRAVAAMRSWAALPPEELRRLTAPDRSATVTYADLEPAAGTALPDSQAALLAHLQAALVGHEVLTVATRVGEVVAAKTLVMGLEVEILSYGRLGEAGVRGLLEADLGLVTIGAGPRGGHDARVCLTAAAEERLGGPAWYSYAAAERLVGPLYPLYREPPRHSVTLAD